MCASADQEPVNLTAAADRLPWEAVDRALRLHARCRDAALEVRGIGLDEADAEAAAAGAEADKAVLYVVICGYGVLRAGGRAIEFTAGDVLFVPGGQAHRLARMDGETRFWRITFAPGPADAQG